MKNAVFWDIKPECWTKPVTNIPTHVGSIDRTRLSPDRRQVRTENGYSIQSPKRRVLNLKIRTVDNVHNCDSYMNEPSLKL
jgi:hypothetical protein